MATAPSPSIVALDMPPVDPPVPPKPKTLAQKILGVMAACRYVEKKGVNTFLKYRYATEADVTDKVSAACIAEGLILVPSLKSITQREKQTRDGHATISQVLMHYRVIDADTGDALEFDMMGEGQDSGDKSVFKAVTGAGKYAHMKLFMIATGDDPEADEKTDKDPGKLVPAKTAPDDPQAGGVVPGGVIDAGAVFPDATPAPEHASITPGQVVTLQAKVQEASTTDDKILQFFSLDALGDLSVADYTRAMTMLEDRIGKIAAKKGKGK